MLGRTHALSGAVAYTAVAPLGLVLLLWRAAGPDLIHSLGSFALTGATP